MILIIIDTACRNRVVAITGDCKSPAVRLRRFESYFRHQIKNLTIAVGFFIWIAVIVLITACDALVAVS